MQTCLLIVFVQHIFSTLCCPIHFQMHTHFLMDVLKSDWLLLLRKWQNFYLNQYNANRATFCCVGASVQLINCKILQIRKLLRMGSFNKNFIVKLKTPTFQICGSNVSVCLLHLLLRSAKDKHFYWILPKVHYNCS